jgi:hypothetical protein
MGATGKVTSRYTSLIKCIFPGPFLAIPLSSQILKRLIPSAGLIQKVALRTISSSSHTALVDGKSYRHDFFIPITEVHLSLKVCVPVCTSQTTHCTLVSHFSCGLSALLNDLTPRSTRMPSWTLLLPMQNHLKSMLFPGSKLRS